MNGDYDNKPFIITMLLIVSFFFAFLIIMAFRPDLLNDIAAIWGGWIGAAIGYFFGSRPVEALTNRVEGMMNEWEISDEESEEEINDLLDDMDDLEDKYNKAVKDIQFIAIKYSERLDNDLLQRLKNDYEILT
jgi:hypothetical protein